MLKEISPVFVVGSARSGTSLVYSIILSSGVYALYAAETLLLRTCADKYGSLKSNRNFEIFLSDWLESKQFNRSGLDRERFILDAWKHRSSYLEYLNFFMTSIAEKQGKSSWAENTPNHVLEISNIARYFPTARFVHVIRDGRAVAASLNTLGWVSCKSPLMKTMSAGIHWEKQVLAGRRQGRCLADRYLELHYEELICDPERILRTLSEFLNIHLDLKVLRENPFGVLAKNNSVYGDQKRGSLFSRSGLLTWKAVLTDREQETLNSVIGSTLRSFGYVVETQGQVNKLTVCTCKLIYNLKEWLKYNTLLGRTSKTGLELNVNPEKNHMDKT